MQRAELIQAVRGVAGWLGDDEAWALHEAARTHPAEPPAITVVEIGSWHGRSTIALANGLRARGAGTVHAIDPHRGSALHHATGVPSTRAAFLANVRAAGLTDYVGVIPTRSSVARARFADRSVHLLFVDGSHLYEDVLSDIDVWTPALTDVAIVAFHDAREEPGVRRVLSERVEPADSPFHGLRMVDNLLVAEFRRVGHATESASGVSATARST